MDRRTAPVLCLMVPAFLTGCTALRVPTSPSDWAVWISAGLAAVIFILGTLFILRRGLLRFLLHLMVTVLLLTGVVWVVMAMPAQREGHAMICLLAAGVYACWTLWAVSGFAVGRRAPDRDDDNFLSL